MNQKSSEQTLPHQPVAGYITGALVMGISAWLCSILPVTFIMVMAILSAPSLFFGYYFAPVFTKYILGLLIGIVIYMIIETFLYGPIYKVTGPVYAASYIFAVASVLLGRLLYIRKQTRLRIEADKRRE